MIFFPKVKINWAKVILSSFIVFIIEMLVKQTEAILTMRYYLMPEYFGIWSKLMMSKVGPPPDFFILSALFSFLTALVLACVYECIKANLDKKFWHRVLGFTKLMALLMLVFGYLPMFLLLNVPQALLISWFVSSSLAMFFGSIVFVKLLK